MNLDIASKWTAALRSGEYKQAQNKLCTGEGFCCLGVLAELYIAAGGTDLHRDDTIDSAGGLIYRKYAFTNDAGKETGMDSALPQLAIDWAGLKSDLGDLGATVILNTGVDYDDYDDLSTPESLADLNDSGLTFAQIADVIDYVAADL